MPVILNLCCLIHIKVNTFVLRPVYVHALVRWYTVRFAGNERSEYADFISRMGSETDPKRLSDLNDLKAAIQVIGNKYGAHMRYFRDEQDLMHRGEAMAVPSKYMMRSQLRLYCQVLSPRVVILFNGDFKTEGPISAQECPKVAPHFTRANSLTRVINQALEEGDHLRWDATRTMLVFNPDNPINP
ncbi:MAG: hypothetical protein CNCCGFBP_00346 [Fimbriimonadaceae bacterium]|nr:hypothetical protein [Fimbriimonadaceae bacterium]